MQIEIPIKSISLNQAYRIKNNRFYMTNPFKEFIKNYINENYKDIVCYNQPISLYIEIFRNDNRRFDVDNCMKLLLDSLKGSLFTDDYLIFELKIRKFIGQLENSINIEIRPMENI